MRIILASSSPRRKKLLEEEKINFEVIPSKYDEDSRHQAGIKRPIPLPA